jgi:hypothetical protein
MVTPGAVPTFSSYDILLYDPFRTICLCLTSGLTILITGERLYNLSSVTSVS